MSQPSKENSWILKPWLRPDKCLNPSMERITQRFQQWNVDGLFLDRMDGNRVFVTKVMPWETQKKRDDTIRRGLEPPRPKSKICALPAANGQERLSENILAPAQQRRPVADFVTSRQALRVSSGQASEENRTLNHRFTKATGPRL